MAKPQSSRTDSIDEFLSFLTSFGSDSYFNPWSDNCDRFDVENSHSIRLNNLRAILRACIESESVDLWVGRDLGWRGGRRTGVPLVDELTLLSYGQSLEIETLAKATTDLPMKERTATEIDLARTRISRKLFFWNVFPFHPHEAGKSLSNRMHTRTERGYGAELLSMVLELLPFERVVTIGRDATDALTDFGIDCFPVRHPSYGGQKEFHQQIDEHYGFERAMPIQANLFTH